MPSCVWENEIQGDQLSDDVRCASQLPIISKLQTLYLKVDKLNDDKIIKV